MITIKTLKKFCATDDSRILHEPFTVGEYTYATNRKIAIRVPHFPSVNLATDPQPIEKQFAEGIPTDPLTKWEKLAPFEYRQVLEDCDECLGTGLVTCDYDHDHECDECEGTGQVTVLQKKAIGVRLFNKEYLALISTLPDCEIAPDFGGREDALAFRFNGGHGLLMPIVRKTI